MNWAIRDDTVVHVASVPVDTTGKCVRCGRPVIATASKFGNGWEHMRGSDCVYCNGTDKDKIAVLQDEIEVLKSNIDILETENRRLRNQINEARAAMRPRS